MEIAHAPDVRIWFLRERGSRLVQLQNDGFFLNWRKVGSGEAYPRYEPAIRPDFEREWARFVQFLVSEGIGSPDAIECEATYVNHFEKGREWSSPGALAGLLRWFAPVNGARSARDPTAVRMAARYEVAGGLLDVSLAPAIRALDRREVLQFNLTVRGRPEGAGPAEVLAWMDGARETIVRGSVDLTTEAMHRIWERVE